MVQMRLPVYGLVFVPRRVCVNQAYNGDYTNII